MRYEDDINTARRMKSICRAALLKDNAPDSEPLTRLAANTAPANASTNTVPFPVVSRAISRALALTTQLTEAEKLHLI